MNVTIEDISQTRKKLIVDFSVEEVQKEEKIILGHINVHGYIPGFRPGKAPAHLIRQHYSRKVVNILNNKLLQTIYEKVSDETQLNIYEFIAIKDDGIKPGEQVRFTVTVDVTPDFPLPEYIGIPREIQEIKVTEQDIENSIEHIRKGHAQFKPVQHAAKKGDYVLVSYEGKINGQSIGEIVKDPFIWGKQEKKWEQAGVKENEEDPAVIEAFIGMKANESKDIEILFPEEFKIRAIAGEKAIYHLKVHEVRECILPEVNEEFLKTIEIENLDQLKERIRENIKKQRERENYQSQQQQIVEVLDKRVEFVMPESGIEQERENIIRKIMKANLHKGVPESEFEKHKQEIFENAHNLAIKQLKMDILLLRIAENEKIRPSDEDVKLYITRQSIHRRIPVTKLVKELEKDHGGRIRMRQAILIEKTMDFLIKKANFLH
jgi:trigger factor